MPQKDVIRIESRARHRAKGKKLPVGASKRKKRTKPSKADFLRNWGILPGTWMRYRGIKGVYWFWLSRSIRERDYKEHGGLCMTCLEYVPWDDSQAGHLFAARSCGFTLLFHPMNIHLQHSKCNNPRFTPSAGVLNAINIEKRYGTGTVELLNQMRGHAKEWTKQEYEARIKDLPAYKNRNLKP